MERVPSSSNQLLIRLLPYVTIVALAASGLGVAQAEANLALPQASGVDTPEELPKAAEATLVNVISSLEAGKSAEVTKQALPMIGPNNVEVIGHPIDYKVGDTSYVAFMQGNKLTFSGMSTAKQIASRMTIIPVQLPSANTKIPLVRASLNKQLELVEDNTSHTPVGYAIPKN